MLVNGEPFNSYLTIYRELRKVAGIASWFTEFQPDFLQENTFTFSCLNFSELNYAVSCPVPLSALWQEFYALSKL
jgi:hypothetical protein